MKLPAHRAGLPGNENIIIRSAFLPTYKAGHPADLAVKFPGHPVKRGQALGVLPGDVNTIGRSVLTPMRESVTALPALVAARKSQLDPEKRREESEAARPTGRGFPVR